MGETDAHYFIWMNDRQRRAETGLFPADGIYLNEKEFEILRYHFGTSSRGGRRYFPYVFTEQGVAILSSVLNSKRAILVNIQIMRTFTQLRKMLATHRELREKIETMEKKYDKRFRIVFETLKLLIKEDEKSKGQLGFSDRKK